MATTGGREKTNDLTVSSNGEPLVMWKKIFSRRNKRGNFVFYLGRWRTVKKDPYF